MPYRIFHSIRAAVFIGISLFSVNAFASVNISASVSPTAVTIGDRFSYEIVIDAGKEAKDPPLTIEAKEPFEVVDAKIVKGKGGGNRIVFTMAAFAVGKLPLPAYVYEWTDEDGNPQAAHSPPVTIEVLSVLPEDEKKRAPKDIEKEAEAKLHYREYFSPVLVFILVVIAVAALIYYLRKRRKPVEKPEVKIPPYEAALERLEKIRSEDLYGEGKIKEYFTQLSDAVRIYMENEFGVEAMELTTCELSQRFPYVAGSHRENVIAMLETCDLAKFSKAVPSPGDARVSLDEAFTFVMETAKTAGKNTVKNGQ